MTQIVTGRLKEDKDGIEGYIAYPERAEKGLAILMIHQHSGLTGYLKTAAYNFAQLGYTAVVPHLYHMLGYPAQRHIDSGTEIQNKSSDGDFVRVIDRGWRYCLLRGDMVRAYTEGVAAMHFQKERANRAIAKYARLKDQKKIDEIYQDSIVYLEKVPRVEPESINSILDFIGKKGTPLETFADNSIVDKMVREGFIDRLYRK